MELKDTGTDGLQVGSGLGKQQSQGTRQNQGLHDIINLSSKPEAGTGTNWHTNTHTPPLPLNCHGHGSPGLCRQSERLP